MLIRLRVVDSCLKPQAESRSPVASKAKYLLPGHLQKVCQLPLLTDASQMLMGRQSPSIWSWPQPYTRTECEVGSAALNSRRLTAEMEANLGNIVKFSSESAAANGSKCGVSLGLKCVTDVLAAKYDPVLLERD